MTERNASMRKIREDRGFLAADVARALGSNEGRLLAFEKGEAAPTQKQLLALARLYGVAPYHLRTGSLPNSPPLPMDFRGRDPKRAQLSLNGYKAFLFGDRISSFVHSVAATSRSNLSLNPLSIPVHREAERLATAYVESIGFDPYRFTAEKSPARANRFIRGNLELSGVCVLNSWEDHSDFRGFYHRYQSSLPTIMVHTRGWDVKSRLFTLLHEVCHFLIDAEGISDPFFSRNATERFCNKFAVHVLAPESVVSDAISHTSTPRSDLDGFVRNVAAKTLLSQHAMAIRLVELGVLDQQELTAWVNGRSQFGDAKKGYATDGVPPDRAEQVLPKFGYLASLAIEDALSSNIASPSEVFSATGIKPELQEELVGEARDQLQNMGLQV